jgi:hypothetical protein
MLLRSPSSPSSGPSLAALVGGFAPERRVLLASEALVVVGRQIERLLEDEDLRPDLALGTLRFSLYRLHQARIARLAQRCRSITVYGLADVTLPKVPGITLLPLAPGHTLCQEWFMLVDSPGFWGALLTHATPDPHGPSRYQFAGALTAEARVVDQAHLLLSLARRQLPSPGERDALGQRARWARLTYALGTHSQAERLGLLRCLAEQRDLLELLSCRGLPPEQLLPQAIATLLRYSPALGASLFRADAHGALVPAAWSGGRVPPPPADDSPAARALRGGTAVVASLPAETEGSVQGARSLVAAPVLRHGRAWGVLCALQREELAVPSAVAPAAVGIATLLGLLLSEHEER